MVPLAFIIPSLIVAVGTGGLIAYRGKKLPESGEEKTLRSAFDVAMHSTKFNEEEVKKLIGKLRKFGMVKEAEQLKKRIELVSLAEEIKEKRELAVRNALSSTDKEKVLELAETFHNEGVHATARILRQYARGLE
jgi:thioredoxin-like negative regulator of GroEL